MRTKNIKLAFLTLGVATLLTACGDKEVNEKNLIASFEEQGVSDIEIKAFPINYNLSHNGLLELYNISHPSSSKFEVVTCENEKACQAYFNLFQEREALLGQLSTTKTYFSTLSKSKKAIFQYHGSDFTLADAVNKIAEEY